MWRRPGRPRGSWVRLRGPALRLVSSSARLEPGVFGIFRPVLWLPAGIADRLDDAELDAILAHELCHARRRDNLAAAIHMAVEAVFWFHPLVWWLGARLTEERERACDEEVVRVGGEPQVYAESILKVCEFYLASPVACASGVTGGGLERRIEGIMANRFARKLSFGKKLLLGAATVAAIIGPLALGIVNAGAPTRGQSGTPQLAFEVASVRPSPPFTSGGRFRSGIFGGPAEGDPGQISYSYMTLARLVAEAYGIDGSQLSGPDWIRTARFDIAAKIPPGTIKEQVPIMLRNLLADRLKLRVHREAREMTVYELMIAAGGPKLKAANEKIASEDGVSGEPRLSRDGFPEIPPGRNGWMNIDGNARWQAYKGKIEDLVKMLITELHAPVTDATGLGGRYDMSPFWVSAKLAANPEVTDDSALGPTIAGALKEQLGLRLVSKRGLGDVLVVDHVERTPTEN